MLKLLYTAAIASIAIVTTCNAETMYKQNASHEKDYAPYAYEDDDEDCCDEDESSYYVPGYGYGVCEEDLGPETTWPSKREDDFYDQLTR